MPNADFEVVDLGSRIQIVFNNELVLLELCPVPSKVRGEIDRHGVESVRNINIVYQWIGGTLAKCHFQLGSDIHVAEWQTRIVTKNEEVIRITVRLLPRHGCYKSPFEKQIEIIKKFIADRLSPGS